MDIAALSIMSAGSKVQQQADILLMRKAMDIGAQNGQAMQQVFQASTGQSLDPLLGRNIDISV